MRTREVWGIHCSRRPIRRGDGHGLPSLLGDIALAIEAIIDTRRRVPSNRSALVGLSGIDGAGKGYVAAELTARLEARGMRVANINIDGWLSLPSVRISRANPAEHFYAHAIRFGALFDELILPLKARRSIEVVADVAEETATSYRQHTYRFADVDVVILEGIYLFKRELRQHFDLALWVECTFATALERAIARAQEGLPPAETIKAYREIYFPAQRIHFERDNPQAAAAAIIRNDPRLLRVSEG